MKGEPLPENYSFPHGGRKTYSKRKRRGKNAHPFSLEATALYLRVKKKRVGKKLENAT